MTDLSHIVEGLRPLAVPITDLKPDPANARKHGAKNLGAIRASFERFGQVKPIAVRKSDGVVIAGNGRLLVAKEMGWTHIAAVMMEGTPGELAAFALVDNKSAELATWDEIALSDLMRSVDVGETDLTDLGFQTAEIERLLDVEEVDTPIPETPETHDAPAIQPPRAPEATPAKAKGGKPVPQRTFAAAGGTIGPEAWKVFQEAAAAMRDDRELPEMADDEVLAALARRYLKGRP